MSRWWIYNFTSECMKSQSVWWQSKSSCSLCLFFIDWTCIFDNVFSFRLNFWAVTSARILKTSDSKPDWDKPLLLTFLANFSTSPWKRHTAVCELNLVLCLEYIVHIHNPFVSYLNALLVAFMRPQLVIWCEWDNKVLLVQKSNITIWSHDIME
jgi:hypothetical protein